MQHTGHGYDIAMAIYTVHIPPQQTRERARFVREGANIFALLIPPLWLLWHRLWLPLAGYLLAVLLTSLFARYSGFVPGLLMSVLPGLYLFVEGNELIRHRLSRAGWEFAGVVSAENAADAEIRLFTEPDTDVDTLQQKLEQKPAGATKPFGRPLSSGQSFGMFPE